MQYHTDFSLKNYNTFGIDVMAKKFISVTTVQQLKTVLQENNDVFLLGGGSNMLLTQNIDATVVHLNLNGVIVNNQTENTVEVTASAGENWHEFVLWCIDQNYGGLENLSLIPGNVGTCPIQNIGAYGFEVKDTITSLEALNKKTLKIETFTNAECEFGYRNSIFKNKAKDQYAIISVTFKLTTKNHNTNTSYGAIQEELKNISNPSLKDISNAVIAIRNSKLPNPKEIGNSGSFFKNPVIDITLFNKLKNQYPEIPSYPVSETLVKVPAGWLIEKAGFKGKRFGAAGVHSKQALVLVNYGDATGKEVYEIAKKIQRKIKTEFEIPLEIEVNVF
ncbi:UDP-N-acetylenolpyruvoylglucosamine reductase [Wenyingzhuangia fucanilytica]|uniref:UDP-N-acetylenolpyruvoylglucosamine reductase n=1 Tax=Wenyingzhuangia fucanilytica TaxID=1790137 RepID=A0A1B1Y4Q5_9FLAO|nr:UDP-N-acetylmuramate dehydrogenase [Wenyingzhuangia fucanilytica]ANW95718.1 UDP-N-acetylenolpyruvoylglucosamine reductase [Wenyingzhuangia fucanilytica]